MANHCYHSKWCFNWRFVDHVQFKKTTTTKDSHFETLYNCESLQGGENGGIIYYYTSSLHSSSFR